MTQTVGYWCDECRTKYVQHKCKDGLPCSHDKAQAVYVYAKGYGKGGEFVQMEWSTGTLSSFLNHRPKPKTLYYGWSRSLWATWIEAEGEQVGEWLHKQEGLVARAFLSRWDSQKEPPIWRRVQLIEANQLAILAGKEEPA